jgi:hypothetical protein
MKSAISPDIWETKRMLITKLYKDEEWPLKQVIKLVQTRDFHPRYFLLLSLTALDALTPAVNPSSAAG